MCRRPSHSTGVRRLVFIWGNKTNKRITEQLDYGLPHGKKNTGCKKQLEKCFVVWRLKKNCLANERVQHTVKEKQEFKEHVSQIEPTK